MVEKISNKKRMGLLSIVFLTLIISSSYLAMNVDSYAPPSGYKITCYGYARDLNTNELLSGATVTLSEVESGMYATTTTKGGYYSISLTVPFYMRFTLRITMTGYNAATATFYSPGTYRKDLYLQPISTHTVTCYGSIIDDYTTDPISYATVVLYDPDGSETKTTTADYFGWYYVSIATTDYKYYNLQASKTGYYPQTKSVYSSGTQINDFMLIQAPHDFTVSGHIEDSDTGSGVYQATVKLYDNNGVQVSSTTSDYYGYYSMSFPTTIYADFTVSVKKDGYITEEKQVYSSGSQTLDFNLVFGFRDDFEVDTIGSNPLNWRVIEQQGFSEVSIVNSDNEGLPFDDPTQLVKISSESGLAATMESVDSHNFDSTNPILLSFQAVFNTDAPEWSDNYGAITVFNEDVFELLSIQISSAGIYYAKDNDFYVLLNVDFNLGQIYTIDIIFQNDENNNIAFTIYVDKELIEFDVIESEADYLSYLRFSTVAHEHSDLYIDNVYFGNVRTGATVLNDPIIIAYPLCKMFAPQAEGVLSTYEYGHTSGLVITFELNFGGKGIGFDTPIGTLLDNTNEDHYLVSFDNTGDTKAIFIRNDYEVDRTEILIPNHEGTYLEFYYNLEYQQTKFDKMLYTTFEEQIMNHMIFYGEYINYLYTSDTTTNPITHYATDPNDNDYTQLEETIIERTTANQLAVAFDIPFLPIKAKLTFSDVVTARTYLQAKGWAEFRYCLPEVSGAVLQVQPYIVYSLISGGGGDGDISASADSMTPITPIFNIIQSNMITTINLPQITFKGILRDTTLTNKFYQN
ncbi:MAG: carboxypeptidase regulatory-like domain-containing protein [Asgard group archaeon]|nr:carboxypeptidase regulatory-like domain-containing protein [Asgard group archaeon]